MLTNAEPRADAEFKVDFGIRSLSLAVLHSLYGALNSPSLTRTKWRTLNVKSKMHYIAFLHDVVLALKPGEPLLARRDV